MIFFPSTYFYYLWVKQNVRLCTTSLSVVNPADFFLSIFREVAETMGLPQIAFVSVSLAVGQWVSCRKFWLYISSHSNSQSNKLTIVGPPELVQHFRL